MELNIEFPTVNIMIGTTPTLVAMELMDLLTPHHAIDRHKVAFLFLDTQAQDVELTRFIAAKREIFDNIESLPLDVPRGMDKAPRIPQEGDPTEPHTFIGNWAPQTNVMGAAGVRNNGHVSLTVSADRIAGTIAAMIGRVMQSLPNDPNPPRQTLYVNIIAFLGGGTGSGILNDIAMLVQNIREYEIRVFIHGLLPFPDPQAGFADRLKGANTTAALLELLALSMATRNHEYTKFLRARRLFLGINQIPAAGIYLYAQGKFPSVNDLTRAMGLNLYLFTTNHTGVGQAIAATFVNHVSTIAQDNRGLTTVFCSSCSLAVWMPTLEISKAYAYKLTEILLDEIINGLAGDDAQNNTQIKLAVDWNTQRCILGTATTFQPPHSTVKKADRFVKEDFEHADRNKIRFQRTEAENRRKKTKDLIDQDWEKWLTHERKTLNDIQDIEKNPIAPRLRVRQLTGKINEYKSVMQLIGSQPSIGPGFPDKKESEVTKFPTKRSEDHQDDCESCAEAYNDWLDKQFHVDRRNSIILKLQDLLNEFEPLIAGLQGIRINIDDHLRQLSKDWANAPGREGRLEKPHLFQISLFDSPYLIQDRARLVETLLYPAVNERLPHWPDGAHSLDANTRQALVKACLQEVGYPQNDKIAQQYVANITQYFTDQYGEALGKLNMFDILRIVLPIGPDRTSADQNASITQIISEHVDNRFKFIGPMFSYNPAQQTMVNSGDGLIVGIQAQNDNDITLFRNSTQRHANLQQIALRTDSLNPHILEINKDIFGISLMSLLDFNERYTSMMSKLLMMIENREKGINPIPQYTSDAMKRLIEDPMALDPYTDENGVVQRRKLYDRVIL